MLEKLETEFALNALETELTALLKRQDEEINLFEILKIDKEVQLSTLLAYLFKWGNKIPIGDRLLNDFIVNSLSEEFVIRRDYNIKVEVHVSDEKKENARRPDIVIESSDKVICIENKIYTSAARRHQIKETVKYIIDKKEWKEKQKKAYLYLTPRTSKGWLLDEIDEANILYGKSCVIKQVFWHEIIGVFEKYKRFTKKGTRLYYILFDLVVRIEKEIDNGNES